MLNRIVFVLFLLLPPVSRVFRVSRGIPSQTQSQVWDPHWPPRLPHNTTHWTSPTKGRMNVSNSTCKPPCAWCTSEIAWVLSSACVGLCCSGRESPVRLTYTQPECQTHCTFHILCVDTHSLKWKIWQAICDALWCNLHRCCDVMGFCCRREDVTWHQRPFFLVSPFNTHFRSFPFYYKEVTEVKRNLWCLVKRMAGWNHSHTMSDSFPLS